MASYEPGPASYNDTLAPQVLKDLVSRTHLLSSRWHPTNLYRVPHGNGCPDATGALVREGGLHGTFGTALAEEPSYRNEAKCDTDAGNELGENAEPAQRQGEAGEN
jgi:hypothetical protein